MINFINRVLLSFIIISLLYLTAQTGYLAYRLLSEQYAGPHHLKGTAFLVKKDKNIMYYVTNWHVCKSRYDKSWDTNQTYFGKKIIYLKNDPLNDLCLFSIPYTNDQKDVQLFEISHNFPIPEWRYVAKCFYWQKDYSLVFMKQTWDYEEHVYVYQYYYVIIPGCSGSPVLDADGKVIGVMHSVIPRFSISFGTTLPALRSFLSDILINCNPNSCQRN